MKLPGLIAAVVFALATAGGLAVSAAPGGPGGRAPVEAGRILVYDGDRHRVTAIAETTGDAIPFPGPQGFLLQPVALTARDGIDRYDPDLAQVDDSIGGVATISLPGGGRLLKYRDRSRQRSGFLHVDEHGRAQVLLELDLIGRADPLLPSVAVSAWEPRAAVLLDEGVTGRGDVFLLRLDGGLFRSSAGPNLNVTASRPAIDAEPFSLTFCEGALFFTDNDLELLRAPADGSADAAPVILPPSAGADPAVIGEEIQVCGDGSTLALLAGESEQLWDLYVGTAEGVFQNLTDAPEEYQQVGHLTSEPLGPFVALSADGRRVTYASESHPEPETFSRRTDGSEPPVQLTADAWFVESIGVSGTTGDYAAGIVIVAGQDQDALDLYRVIVADGAVQDVFNLTGTSGDAGAPWDKGATLCPVVTAHLGRGRLTVVVDDRSAELGRPSFDLWTAGVTGARLQLSDLESIPRVVSGRRAGPGSSQVSAVLSRTAGGERLDLLPERPEEPLHLLLQAPVGVSLTGLSLDPSGGEAALVARAGPDASLTLAVDLRSGRVRLPLALVADYGAQTSWSPGGGLLFSAGFGGRRLAFLEAPSGPTVLPAEPGRPWFLQH